MLQEECDAVQRREEGREEALTQCPKCGESRMVELMPSGARLCAVCATVFLNDKAWKFEGPDKTPTRPS